VISTYYVSTPLVPDTDYDLVSQVFGEKISGVDGRQIPRTNFRVSSLVGINILRMTNAGVGGGDLVYTGSAFDIEAGRAYELQLGGGPLASYPLRFTGYVSETPLSVNLDKPPTVKWFAYSMPRTITLASLNLPTVISPWIGTNRVRILWHGRFTFDNYSYAGGVWSPANPDLVPGTGMILVDNGPVGAMTLMEETWYLHPPNTW
jgi:hypothetical protein